MKTKHVDTQAIIEKYEQGKTVKQAAFELGVSTGYAYYRLRDAGVKFRKSGVPNGFKHTEESKKRMSAAMKGRSFSAETIEKMAESKRCHYNGLNGYGHTKLHCRGYILAYAPDHPNAYKDGYIMLHTVVVERKIGRYLRNDEEVHHINHIRNDNRIENLRLMLKTEHRTKHMLQRHGRISNF